MQNTLQNAIRFYRLITPPMNNPKLCKIWNKNAPIELFYKVDGKISLLDGVIDLMLFIKNYRTNMKKSILLAVVLLLSGCQERKASFIKRFDSQNDMQTTISKLKEQLPKHGLVLTSEFDEGKYANLLHRDKKLIFFTNPKASTDLMKCDAALSLEVPYKMAISKNYDGTVEVIYTNPEYWSLQYNVKDKNCLSIISKFAGVMDDMANTIIQK